MSSLREMCRRARDRARAPVRGRWRPRRIAPELEAQIREVLRQAAETITCRGDGLELIRHKASSGAPLAGGAAVNDDDLGSPTS